MPTMETEMYLPEYRVTLGAEFYVTAKSPREAVTVAFCEAMDQVVADTPKSKDHFMDTAFDNLFTTVMVEKVDDDDDDDEDGDDDAPDDMPRKPKKPAKMKR